MNVSELYSQTLSSLIATRSKMLTPAWQNSLATLDPQARADAGEDMLDVQLAITTLSEAALSSIATQMASQENDLTNATNGLNNALADLTKTQTVLNSITQVLTVVGKIVPLL